MTLRVLLVLLVFGVTHSFAQDNVVPRAFDDLSSQQTPALPEEPVAAAAEEADMPKDPCAAYPAASTHYIVCKDRFDKIERMREIQKRQNNPAAVTPPVAAQQADESATKAPAAEADKPVTNREKRKARRDAKKQQLESEE